MSQGRNQSVEVAWDLVVTNCRIGTMDNKLNSPYGAIASDGALGVSCGILVYVGSTSGLPQEARSSAKKEIDLGGKWVTPGLIDCHTHVVYGGQRAAEWELKLKGATYEEVCMSERSRSTKMV